MQWNDKTISKIVGYSTFFLPMAMLKSFLHCTPCCAATGTSWSQRTTCPSGPRALLLCALARQRGGGSVKIELKIKWKIKSWFISWLQWRYLRPYREMDTSMPALEVQQPRVRGGYSLGSNSAAPACVQRTQCTLWQNWAEFCKQVCQ